MNQDLTIIIPVFNGARFLEGTLKRLADWIRVNKNKIELIAVNDGSSDNTADILRDFKQLPSDSYSVINLPKNKGKGFALREGFKKAEGEYIGFTDIELPYGLEVFDGMLEIMKNNKNLSFLYGSRSHILSKWEKEYGFIRKLGRKFFSFVIRFLLLPDIADTQCGIKMLRNNFRDIIIKKSIINRFATDVEMFVIAYENNLAVRDFPVEFVYTKGSTVHLLRDTILMLKDILCVKIRRFLGLY